MRRTRGSEGRRVALGPMAAAALAVTSALTASVALDVRAAAAQEVERECRCVDEDGREIEDCRCFGLPPRLEATMLSLTAAPKARIGVSVSADQAGEDVGGVRIMGVSPGAPAEEAGLREGDVVVRVDGRSVLEPIPHAGPSVVRRFTGIVGDLEPGEPVEIEYLRDGATRRATITPEEAEAFPARQLFRFRGPDEHPHVFSVGGDRDGIRLQSLNSQLAGYFGVDGGVLVLEVLEDAALGLRAGDVIVSIGERPVEEPGDVRRILASYEPDEPVSLTVVRKGERVQLRGTRRGA